MASEWTSRPLEDCMAALIDYRGKTPTKTSFGIPLITAKVVKGGRIETPDEFISVDDYEPWMRRGIPKAGDVVITTEAPLGEVAQLGSERVALAQRLIALRGKDELLDNGFLKFLMQSENVQDQLRARASGSTVLGIKQSELRKVVLTFPPIDEQRAIAYILGTLDDKIELNRRMNGTLEAIARAIFKSWFVDFDPVRAKASGEPPESICRRLGLTPDLLALFPDRLVDSELGEIPDGWGVGSIADHCHLNEVSWTAKTLPAEVNYVDLANAKNGEISEVQVFSFSAAPSRARRVLRAGDTIVGTVRPGNRSFALIGEGAPQLTGSTGFAVLSPRRPELRELVYFLSTSDENIDRLSRLADGAAYPAVRPEVVCTGPCVVPTSGMIDALHEAIGVMIDYQMANQISGNTLASLRDTLLPKFLSSELRLPVAGAA